MPWNIFQHFKWNKVLTHATIWMNLENIMLSERSQTKDHILCDFICTKYSE